MTPFPRTSGRIAQVAVTALLLVGLAACSPSAPPPGITAPSVSAPAGLSATASEGGVVLNWQQSASGNASGYLVYRGTSADGSFAQLTPQPIRETSYTDVGAPEGVVSYYRVVTVGANGATSKPATASATRPISNRPTQIALTNLDGLPAPGRLVFNRLHSNPSGFAVHDKATVRLQNTGAAPLHVTGAQVSDGWTLDPALSFPRDVPAGGTLDFPVTFVADQDASLPPKLYTGTLTIVSSDPATPQLAVQLAGLWQSASERFASNNFYDEPGLDLIRQAFGFNFAFSTPADAAPSNGHDTDGSNIPINQRGAVKPQGDEVISAYWQRADQSQQVSVQEIAAWSGQTDSARLNWHAKGSRTLNQILQRAAGSAQTLFPRTSGSGTFTPPDTFGFNVDGYEWSDAGLNSQSSACANFCGQHLRFWPLKDAAGAAVPNSYLMVLDYGNINFDYQDEIYLVRNVKPAPILLDVGKTNSMYTSPSGQVWLPDRRGGGTATNPYYHTYFTPINAVDEPAQPYTGPITATDDPQLYRTYRGNVGASTPQNQRNMTFNVPINNGSYTLKLHFADLAHNQAGQRVFDVSVNGVLSLPNFDIVAAGGGQQAVVETFDNLAVTNGRITVNLNASVDFPALNAIEIVR